MRKLFPALLIGLILSGCCTGKKDSAPPLTITSNSHFRIVLPEQTRIPEVLPNLRRGAAMLQRAFKEGLGMDVPIQSESTPSDGAKSIFIGETQGLQKLGINPAKYPSYAFIIAEDGGNIYIAGEDKYRIAPPVSYKTADHHYILGSINGCVKFAEKYLKTRFLYPGANGVDYAKDLKEVKIPSGLRQETFPRLLFAGDYHREMFYSYSNNTYGTGSFKTYGGHSYYDAVPKAKYAKSNPEYFALVGGRRDSNYNHLCISNPEVQELIYQEMLKWLDQGANTVQLAQTDGYRPCGCDQCRVFGNTDDPGEKLWILHRNLALRLQKERPGKNAHIISYGPTFEPPKTFSEFPPNVIIELCSYTPESFEAWNKLKVPGGFTTYIYNWGWYQRIGFLPKRTPKFCADQVRIFCKNNVRGIYRCGFGENFGLEAPSYYVYGQMFNDPSLDEKVLTDDFLRRAFHESYAPMQIFFDTLNTRLELYSRLSMNPSVLPHNPRVSVTAIFSPEILDILTQNLERAEKLAKNAKVKARLELVRTEFDYAKNLATTLHCYNNYRLFPNQANFDQLAKLIEERNALIQSYDNGKGRTKLYSKNWPDLYIFRYPEIKIVKENGHLSAPIGAPLNWNTKLLREKKILPGVGKRSLTVAKADGNISTTDFNSGAWSKAKWQELGGIQLGAIKDQTRFKAVYDAKNIYFAFESDIAAAKKFQELGRDGFCFGVDCIELFLDPTGTRDYYYHLIYNPIKNSYFDSAFGLISDVLHPLYNKADPSWNGKWSYQTARKGDKWYSVVTVPFKELNAPPPGSGTIWYGNFGREAFENPKDSPELSLWSPNLETMSFGDREAFGELIFE